MPPKKTEKPPKRISVDKQLTQLEDEREEISYDKHPERHGVIFSEPRAPVLSSPSSLFNGLFFFFSTEIGKDFARTGSCTNIILSCFCLCIVIGVIIGIVYLAGGFDGGMVMVNSPTVNNPTVQIPPTVRTATTLATNASTTAANATETSAPVSTVL